MHRINIKQDLIVAWFGSFTTTFTLSLCLSLSLLSGHPALAAPGSKKQHMLQLIQANPGKMLIICDLPPMQWMSASLLFWPNFSYEPRLPNFSGICHPEMNTSPRSGLCSHHQCLARRAWHVRTVLYYIYSTYIEMWYDVMHPSYWRLVSILNGWLCPILSNLLISISMPNSLYCLYLYPFVATVSLMCQQRQCFHDHKYPSFAKCSTRFSCFGASLCANMQQ